MKTVQRTSVTIQSLDGKWVLIVATNLGTPNVSVTRRDFNRLVEAMDFASLVGHVVDNADDLPIQQYYKAA